MFPIALVFLASFFVTAQASPYRPATPKYNTALSPDPPPYCYWIKGPHGLPILICPKP